MDDALIHRAEDAFNADEARRVERGGPSSPRRDSQNTYPQDWTHARFLRFLDDTAP